MSIGQIVQVIGAVVDIEFPRDAMPKIYEALVLKMTKPTVSPKTALRSKLSNSLATASCVHCNGHVRRLAPRHEG